MENLTAFVNSLANSQFILLAAVGLGALIAVLGIGRWFSERNLAAQRMADRGGAMTMTRSVASIDRQNESLLDQALLPSDEDEQFQVALALSRAGMNGPGAVRNYYLFRIFLALALPLIFVGCLIIARIPDAPAFFGRYFSGISSLNITQWVVALAAIGFYVPTHWLNARIKRRRIAIEEAFPNMLDLLQVGVEAGMGFDQALLKVSTEIQPAAPDLAEEMIILLSEIQAGRDRDRALMHMARRTGLDEMTSFASVVIQASRFGTSISDALTTYAEDLRQAREMRAEEKANKLPVQMSAVMASIMLPSLIALILAPIIIRYVTTFS